MVTLLASVTRPPATRVTTLRRLLLLPFTGGGVKGVRTAKKKSNHIRVHANLIEGFWELTLALPGDNPWRNDDL